MIDRTATLTAADAWFRAHGLPYFLADERAAVRAALRPRHLVPRVVVILLVAAAVGGVLAWLSDTYSAGPALWLSVAVLGLAWYGVTALRARPILGWAGSRTLGSLRLLLPMASRALPLLLVFVTFLFINAEAWQMTSSLPFGLLWFAVLLLIGLAVLFLLVRLPEEVDRTDDAVDDEFLLRACRGTPLEEASVELVADEGADVAAHAEITGYERWNLILVLLVVQTVQVLLLVVAVFAFFLLFGSLIMTAEVQLSWTGLDHLTNAPLLKTVSTSLMKVSLFLAAFSGLYFTVAAVTDDTYRRQFFATVEEQLERAVGMRAVHHALVQREVTDGGTPAPPAPAG
jgi:hypothetical protein